MASVTFLPTEEKPPIDQRLEQLGAVAAGVGKPIRVRIQPDIYDYESQANLVWPGLIWVVELQDVEEGRRLREGLEKFFAKFGASEESQKKLLNWLRNGKGNKKVVEEPAGV